MAADRDDDTPGTFASPPCSLREADAAWSGLSDADLVAAWRKTERERLIRERRSIPADERGRMDARLIATLAEVIGDARGLVVSAYWPFKGEPDLRPLLADLAARGARTALPIVVEKGSPLMFRTWRDGEALERGVWNIPVPAAGDLVTPDIAIAPLVGFDRAGYRLGYGGGFFDRTLAGLVGARAIGVGYACGELPTIHPQPHDIPMDIIVTESAVLPLTKARPRPRSRDERAAARE